MKVNIIGKVLVGLAFAQVLVSVTYAQEQAPALRRTPIDQVPEWTITHINGGAYQATTNAHGTVFVVTSEGIILADPLSFEFATWLKGEFATR
ncbi:MAG: hypothetical protein HOJ88_07130, partial [Proteobacteria bacterium]|nr:hypothetical protein [Pseudomonadota bacterium]